MHRIYTGTRTHILKLSIFIWKVFITIRVLHRNAENHREWEGKEWKKGQGRRKSKAYDYFVHSHVSAHWGKLYAFIGIVCLSSVQPNSSCRPFIHAALHASHNLWFASKILNKIFSCWINCGFYTALCMWAIAKDEDKAILWCDVMLCVAAYMWCLIQRFIFDHDEFLRKPEYALMNFLWTGIFAAWYLFSWTHIWIRSPIVGHPNELSRILITL